MTKRRKESFSTMQCSILLEIASHVFVVVCDELVVVVVLLPLIIEVIAAARAAVKFGLAVMAAVAALTESLKDVFT